ncbi:uncharacterized protein LOC117101812 isoform X2 [Anneissia japonica]|uniref:uncharacterized protein LOC117101812 isoform X2 n=1 Tax=Anneissia japonica TaxID=1529436 RepID=UPI001425A107|nr:uncharacterized protein LOC117101812 isoform X2 [Anneissia japonica]
MFKNHVVLAYTDIAAAGSRAALSIDHKVERRSLDIRVLHQHLPACTRQRPIKPMDTDPAAIQVLNCAYEQLSIVVVNTQLKDTACHHVINEIINHCDESSEVETITVVAAIHIDDRKYAHKIKGLHENTFRCPKVTQFPSLPDDIHISDPFMNTLLQFLIIEDIPARIFTVPGFKSIGKPSTDDGSLQSITALQMALHESTALNYSIEAAKTLVLVSEALTLPYFNSSLCSNRLLLSLFKSSILQDSIRSCCDGCGFCCHRGGFRVFLFSALGNKFLYDAIKKKYLVY